MVFKRVVITVWTIFLTVVIGITLSPASSHDALAQVTANLSSCEAILTQALAVLQNSCTQLGRNTACYGNNQVTAKPSGNGILKFDQVGDTASIQSITSIDTSPMDLTNGLWGLSVLKLQANLPDTLPGQNVTFLIYGNTHVENTSGDMQAFYFSSGLGTPDCKVAPHDGILVKSPNHTRVTFNANGAQITIASTILLQAQPNKVMTVSLIEGHAQVSTASGTQTLLPGQSVSVPLGGSNGLSANGAPAVPVAGETDPTVDTMVTAAQEIGDAAPSEVTLVGCITAVHGNKVTINGYTINVGSDHTLKAAKVGDCVQISGEITSDANTLPKQSSTNAKAKSDDGNKDNNAGNSGNNGNNGNGNGNGNGGNGNGKGH